MKQIFITGFIVLYFTAHSKQDRFVGLIDNVMVQVNPFIPSVETIVRLDFPDDVTGSDMTYSEDDCLFYTIIDATERWSARGCFAIEIAVVYEELF